MVAASPDAPGRPYDGTILPALRSSNISPGRAPVMSAGMSARVRAGNEERLGILPLGQFPVFSALIFDPLRECAGAVQQCLQLRLLIREFVPVTTPVGERMEAEG
ncbi:hypothetical protein SALBM311S_04358 [Streptomyces alboniger]